METMTVVWQGGGTQTPWNAVVAFFLKLFPMGIKAVIPGAGGGEVQDFLPQQRALLLYCSCKGNACYVVVDADPGWNVDEGCF